MKANITFEARTMQGPWTTLVKGRGLGTSTRNYNPQDARHIRRMFDITIGALPGTHAYTNFSATLTNFILDFVNPENLYFMRKDLFPKIEMVFSALNDIKDAYDYISASSVLFETFGKLGLDPQLTQMPDKDLVEAALSRLSELPQATPEQKYKALQAYGSLFLGITHIGMRDRIIEGHCNYVEQAFAIVNSMEEVWYRGRGTAAFLTVLGIIGLGELADHEPQHVKNLLDFLSDSLNDEQKVKDAPNVYIFAILLSLNAISVLNKTEYLQYKRDWISVSQALLDKLTPDLRIIFSHYYVSVLQNLNKLGHYIPDSKNYASQLIQAAIEQEAGELTYMGHTYLVDLSYRLNSCDVIPENFTDVLVSSINHLYDASQGYMPKQRLYGSGFMRLAYAFLALIPIGKANALFTRETGDTHSLAEKIVLNQIENWGEDYSSLPFLCHALLDAALNLRGLNAEKTIVDRFLESSKIFGKSANTSSWGSAKKNAHNIGIHAFFPGMNSRRAYVNLARDLYYDGAPEVQDIFEQSARILNYRTPEGELDITPFFMEEKDVPTNVVAKWNFIGSAMTVYNLALFTHLKKANPHIHLHSVGGESFGMIAAAVVAGSLSLEDGLKVANTTLGYIYEAAHSGTRDIWHIVSLRGKNLRHILTLLQMNFPDKIDVFRWHALNTKCDEAHLYVHTKAFSELRESIQHYGNDIELNEFKKPTFEIIHSPKLFQARIDINHYLQREHIKFLDPQIPILANNGSGLICKGEDIRQSILDMVDIPMYTAQTMSSLKNSKPGAIDAIIEVGYGQKTRALIKDNQVNISFTEYFGDRYRLAAITRDLHKLRLEPSRSLEAQLI